MRRNPRSHSNFKRAVTLSANVTNYTTAKITALLKCLRVNLKNFKVVCFKTHSFVISVILGQTSTSQVLFSLC